MSSHHSELSSEWWLDMARNRLWSTFSRENFSDAQLAAGIEDRSAGHAGRDTISFTEQVVSITACKQGYPETQSSCSAKLSFVTSLPPNPPASFARIQQLLCRLSGAAVRNSAAGRESERARENPAVHTSSESFV